MGCMPTIKKGTKSQKKKKPPPTAATKREMDRSYHRAAYEHHRAKAAAYRSKAEGHLARASAHHNRLGFGAKPSYGQKQEWVWNHNCPCNCTSLQEHRERLAKMYAETAKGPVRPWAK